MGVFLRSRPLFSFFTLFSQLCALMSNQAKSGEAAPAAQPNQTTFLDEVITTFSSPMAWLLVVALILTWSGVAIVLFDLLDYKTLAGTAIHFMALLNQKKNYLHFPSSYKVPL